MAITLNLQKSQAALQLNLQKAGIITPPSVEMMFILDVSGSFETEHINGTTNDLITRLVPWGMTFDPDKKLDLLTFSNGPNSVQNVGPVTDANYKDFVKKNIINKVEGWNGGTDYSYALEESLKEFGWIGEGIGGAAPAEKPGFFGKLFSKKETPAITAPTSQKRKSLVIFVTDGENSDRDRTTKILQESENRHDGCYFLFIGVGHGNFSYLKQAGDKFANTAFYEIKDLKKFISMSDEDLYGELMQEELMSWMKS